MKARMGGTKLLVCVLLSVLLRPSRAFSSGLLRPSRAFSLRLARTSTARARALSLSPSLSLSREETERHPRTLFPRTRRLHFGQPQSFYHSRPFPYHMGPDNLTPGADGRRQWAGFSVSIGLLQGPRKDQLYAGVPALYLSKYLSKYRPKP